MSLFDQYEGQVPGYDAALNPLPEAGHHLNSNFRYTVPRRAGSRTEISIVIHGDNLTNREVWLPDWGEITGDTIPVLRGRTIYFGVELSAGGSRRPGR